MLDQDSRTSASGEEFFRNRVTRIIGQQICRSGKNGGLGLAYTRRDFLKVSSAAALCGPALLQSGALHAQTLKLPLAIQLYSVRNQLPTDFAGTLKTLAGLGYREVEAAGYYNNSAADVKKALDDAGLKLISAHYTSDDLNKQFDQIMAFNNALGVSTIICSMPAYKDPSRLAALAPRDRNNAYTIDDWRWNADQFNQFGDKVHAAGMKFGYAAAYRSRQGDHGNGLRLGDCRWRRSY